MKKALFLSFAALSSAAVIAQNTAVINQQGKSHDVSVVQQGSGNTSVTSQSGAGSSNSVVISQSGAGNIATISQGGTPDGTTEPKNSVTTSQWGKARHLSIKQMMAIRSAFIKQGSVRLTKKRNQPKNSPESRTIVRSQNSS